VTHPAHKPSAPGPAGPPPAARSADQSVPGNVAPRLGPVQVAESAPELGKSVHPGRNVIAGRRHRAPAARTGTSQLAPTASGKPSLPDNTNVSALAGPPEGRSSLSDVAQHFGPPPPGQPTLEPEDRVQPASTGPSMGGDAAHPATTASRRRHRQVPTVPGGPARRISDTTEPTESRPPETPRGSLDALNTRYAPPSTRAPRSPAAGRPSLR
jgi:hypothetical protein